MAKFFKKAEYDPTKVRQAPGYDAGAQYKHNRNTPTSHAIRQLGAEWIYRKPPKGVFKESKIPVNQGSHLKTAGVWGKFTNALSEGFKESDAELKQSMNHGWETLKAHGRYGKHLSKHKFYVYKTGREYGTPRIPLLKHDMSKFLPSEWVPYTNFWEGPEGVKGTSKSRTLKTRYGLAAPAVYDRFRSAVDKHYRRNPHHYHKIGREREQDFNTKLEMIADWYSTSRGIHEQASDKPFPGFRDWYGGRRASLKIGPEVIAYIDNYLLNSK